MMTKKLELRLQDGQMSQATARALIDLVNSQQEAIEKLEKRVDYTESGLNAQGYPTYQLEPADDKPEYPWTDKSKARVARYEQNLAEADTHRTVTLRIPKGMRVGDAFNLAYLFSDSSWEEFITRSDTDLQKALDEVQPNE